MRKALYPVIPPVLFKAWDRINREGPNLSWPFSRTGIDRNIEVVFDVGANIGTVTKSAYDSFPHAKIYAFEPVKSTYATLCKNLQGRTDRVLPFNIGFFNANQKVEINLSSFHGASSIIEQSKDHIEEHRDLDIKEVGKEEIEVRTMDSFVTEHSIGKIDVVKIDVEGVEREVIEGGRETLKNQVDNVLVELSLLRRNRESEYWLDICYDLQELGFMLINLYDVARYERKDRTYLAQMDAYFSKKK